MFIDKHMKKNIRIPERFILKYIVDILSGLQRIHRIGIIHRDLKPSNILIDGKGNAKINDFGVSKTIDGIDNSDNETIGTRNYMSPEVLKGEDYDTNADIWSLGCIAYEMCCFKVMSNILRYLIPQRIILNR